MLSLFSPEPEALGVAEPYEGRLGRPRPVAQMLRAHRHYELEVNLVLQGTAVYLLNDRKYHLRRNTVVWLFPGQDHILLDMSADFEMWIVIFRPGLVQRLCTAEACRVLGESDPEGFFSKQLAEDQAEDLSAHFERVRSFAPDPCLYNAALGYALLLAWRLYQDADFAATGGSLHPAVEATLRLMRRDDAALPIPEIAKQVGLSQSRLSRLFQRQTGLSLTAFRNVVRIERFRGLYGHGNRTSMLRAALDAGFGSYPQFHRVFRQVIGTSPQEHYRSARKV